MQRSSFLNPKPPALLRVSESQAISNSSSCISSTSSLSLFDRTSGASSGCLTDLSSPYTPSTAEFGSSEDVSVSQPSDSPTKEQASLASSWGRHDRALFSPRSRLPQRTSVSLINRSGRLDRACALGSRSSVRSYSQNGTPFLSLIPIAVAKNEDRRYHPDSEDNFDAVTILRNRLERGNPTVATRHALEFMDPGSRPSAICPNESVVGAAEAPVTVVITGPDSPVEDWSGDFELPSKPVLDPVISDSPCSPFILGTPHLSFEWQGSSLSTLMAESPSSPISSPANTSIDEEEMARIMRTFLSFPTPPRQSFTGSPKDDVDAATVIASTFPADHPHASQTRTLIGLGVEMPAIYPPLPETLFPFHHPPGATLGSRSLQDLGYRPFDDKMFEIEQTALAILSRNVIKPSPHENVERNFSGIGFEINESLLYSPLEGCTEPTPLLPEVDFECSDTFQLEQAVLSLAHTPLNHTSPIIFGKSLVGLGLGLGGLTEASVESQPPPAEPSPTTGRHHMVSVDGSVTEVEAAPLPVSDFYRQVQNSLIFEPLGVQKSIELDASLLERQSALYHLEHTDLLLDHIFSYSPPIKIEERTEIERQLASFSKKQLHSNSKSQRHFQNLLFSSPVLSLRQDYNNPCTLTTNRISGVEQPPRSVKQRAVSNIFSKGSYQALKKLGLERLAIFQPRTGRDDLDLTSPTITPQDDPRSPYQSTLERFLTFTSINPPSEMHSPMKIATTSTGFDIKQSSGSALDKELVTHPKPEDPSKSNKNMQIGLGLPSSLVFRRPQLQQTSSQGTIDAVRCQSRRSSQEFQNPSLVVIGPSFASSRSRVRSDESSNQFLKPSHFAQRSLYDIVEVPTPPSSTSCSPRETPSPRNQWSSPFTRLNPPQKRQSFKSQLSTPSMGSLSSSIHADTETGATNEVPLPEVHITPSTSARSGFKRIVSKFTRDIFKRSRSLKKGNPVSSPGLIEHADAPPGLRLLLQDNHSASCGGDKENGFTSSAHKLQLLF
ncbi:hypothetical protein BYT27DRAFT_7250951 [Phlegmacium glaucopus]|nr:hypothetical protein BYT27DRAFT_7250951 [Phlegmacium glaucopus]